MIKDLHQASVHTQETTVSTTNSEISLQRNIMRMKKVLHSTNATVKSIAMLILGVLFFANSWGQNVTIAWPFTNVSLLTGSATGTQSSNVTVNSVTASIFSGATSQASGSYSGTGIKASNSGTCLATYTGLSNLANTYMEFGFAPNTGFNITTNQFTFTLTSSTAVSAAAIAVGYSSNGGTSFTGCAAPVASGTSSGGYAGATLQASPLFSNFGSTNPLTAQSILTFTVPACTISNGSSFKLRIVISKNNNSSSSATNILISGPSITGTVTANSCTSASISTQPANAAICTGGTATFTATAGGSVTSYAWYESTNSGSTWSSALADGGVYSGSSSATLTLNNPAGKSGYQYKCIATASCNSSTTTTDGTATLSINSLPSAPSVTPGSRCGTGTVALSSTPTSGDVINWYAAASSGTPLSTSSNSYTTVSISSTTTYYAVDSNTTTKCASSPRTSIAATVYTAITNAVMAAGTGNNYICGSGSANIKVTVTGGTSPYTFVYTGNGGGTVNSYTSATNYAVSPTSTTAYGLTSVTDANGCTAASPSGSPTVTVNALPSAPSVTPNSRCGTGTIGLSATPTSGDVINWYAATANGAPLSTSNNNYTTASLSSSTTYYAVDSNTTTKCASSPRTSVLASINPAITAAVLAAGTGSGTICNGNSANIKVTVTGGTAPYTFVYTGNGGGTKSSYISGADYAISPSSTTTYGVTSVTDANSCSAASPSGTATVTVNPRPTAVVSGGSTFHAGQSGNISVALTGTSPWNLTYTDGTTPVSVTGISASSYIVGVSPLISTTYTVTALSDANCTAQLGDITGSAFMNITNLTPQNITLATTNSVTYGVSPYSLGATTDNPSGVALQYNSSNTGVATIDASGNVTVVGAGSTTITVTQAGDANYADGIATQALTVNKASSSISITNINTPYTYSASAQGPSTASYTTGATGAVTYSYSGTVTATSTAYGPTATAPTLPGTYSVTATLASDNNYFTSTSTAANFTIAKAQLIVTANNQIAVTYGSTAASVTAAGSYAVSGYVGTDNSGNVTITGSPTYTTNYTATTAAGTAGVIITPVVTTMSATNYSIVAATGTITVIPASLTVTTVNQSKPFGVALSTTGVYNSTFTVSGLKGTDAISGGSGTLAFGGTPTGDLATATVAGSPYSISISGVSLTFTSGSASNYIITPANTGTLTVSNALAIWPLTQNGTALVTSAVTANSEALGSQIGSQSYSSIGHEVSKGATANTAWGITSSTDNYYTDYTITAAAGNSLTVTGFSALFAASASGGATIDPKAQMRYYVDNLSNSTALLAAPGFNNGITSGTKLTSTSLVYLTGDPYTFGSAITLAPGQYLHVRVYIYDNTTSGTHDLVINSVTIIGTSCALPSIPSISGSTSPCTGSTGNDYSIGAISGAISYGWTVPTGWSITANNTSYNPTITAGSASGNITVTVANSCGSSSKSLSVNTTALPTVSLASYSIFSNGATTVSPASGGTWVSSDPLTATVANDGSGTVTPLQTGTLNFIYTDGTSGCSNTTANLTISNLPAATISFTNGTPYTYTGVGQAPTYSTNSTGTITYSYTGISGTSYGPSTTSPIQAGHYQLSVSVGSDVNYAANTATENFDINKVVLSLTANNQYVAFGTATTTVTTNGSYTATGFVNSETAAVISGTATYSTTYTNTTPVGTIGTISILSTAALSATNYSFSLASPGTGTVTVGTSYKETFDFYAGIANGTYTSGTGYFSSGISAAYQNLTWNYTSGTFEMLTGINTTSLRFHSGSTVNTVTTQPIYGLVAVKYNTSFSSSGTGTMKMEDNNQTVLSSNNLTSTASVNNGYTWANPYNNTVTFTTTATSSTNAYYLDDVTFTFAPPSGQSTINAATNISGTSMTINWTRPGNDQGSAVFVADASGSTTPVWANPTNGTSYVATAAFGSSTELGTGYYCVYSGNGNSVNVTGVTSGHTYNIYVVDYNGFAEFKDEFYNLNAIPSSTATTLSCTSPSTYTVIGTTAVCSSNTAATVTLSNSQNGVMYQLYEGASTSGSTVSGTGSALTFNVTPSSTTTYSVQTVNAGGYCPATMTGSAIVTVNAIPTITTTGTVTAKCASASAQTSTLTYSAESGTATSYSIVWANNDITAQSTTNTTFSSGGGTISTIAIPAATLAGSYTGTLTIKNANTCTADQAITLVVNAIPSVSVTTANSVCLNASAQTTSLAYSSTSGSPTMYGITWNSSPTNSFATVANTTSLPSSPITISIPAATAANTYTGNLIVKNASGCSSASSAFTVTINALPIPSLSNHSSAQINSQLNYTTDAGMSNYVWTISGSPAIASNTGTGYNLATVSWNSNNTGNQTINVSYTDANGCIGSTTNTTNVSTLQASPTFTAAISATVDNSFNITFPNSSGSQTWWGLSPSVSVQLGSGTINTLPANAYTFSNGKLTLIPANSAYLQTAGTYTVTASVSGYGDAVVSQGIAAGANAHLNISSGSIASPVTYGGTLSTVTLYFTDQYGNNTNSSESVTASINGTNAILAGTKTVSATAGASSLSFSALTASTSDGTSQSAYLTFTSTSSHLTVGSNATTNFTISAYATIATDYFRSNGNGNWTTATNWQSSPDNVNWYTASLAPTSSAKGITIQANHTITATAAFSSANLTVNGTYVHAFVGTIPTASWSATSTCYISGATTAVPGGLATSINFGNFTWDCSGQTAAISLGGNLQQVSGNLSILNTGTGSVTWSSSTSAKTITVGGNLIIGGAHAATLTLSTGTGAKTLAVAGNVTIAANGILTSTSGTNNILLTGNNSTISIDPASTSNFAGINVNIGDGTTASLYTLNSALNTTSPTITIAANSSLALNGNALTVNGAIAGNGLLVGSAASSITMKSTSTNTLNFSIASSANLLNSLTLSGAGTTKLGSDLGITKLLSLSNAGSKLDINGHKLTLKSSTSGTAEVDQVKGSIVDGTHASSYTAPDGITVVANTATNITVERYIPQGKRNYRDLGPAVANAGTVFANWQENGAGSPAATYGVYITGKTGTPGYAAYDPTTGFDLTTNGNTTPSLYSCVSGNWAAVTTATGGTKGINLDPVKGLRLLIRGSRNFNMGTNPTNMPTATTLKATGSLVTGTVTFNAIGSGGTVSTGGFTSNYGLTPASAYVAGEGWSFIANPYACPVSWSSIINNAGTTGTNVGNFYCFLDPTYQNGGLQRYVTVQYNGSAFVTNRPAGIASDAACLNIQPGQGFWVYHTAATPKLVMQESDKVVGGTQTTVFRTAKSNMLNASIWKDIDGVATNVDETVATFDNNYTKAIGAEDVKKLMNGSENISIVESNTDLSINGIALPSIGDEIALRVGNVTANTAYQLKVDASQFAAPGVQAFIKDALLNTIVPAETVVNFTATTDANTYKNRFSVVFKSAKVVPATTVKGNISVYPNPVTEKSFNLQLTGIATGKYNVVIVNSLGQEVFNTTINHKEGSTTENVKMNQSIPGGLYTVVLRSAEGKGVYNTELLTK